MVVGRWRWGVEEEAERVVARTCACERVAMCCVVSDEGVAPDSLLPTLSAMAVSAAAAAPLCANAMADAAVVGSNSDTTVISHEVADTIALLPGMGGVHSHVSRRLDL